MNTIPATNKTPAQQLAELLKSCPRTVRDLIDLDDQRFYEWQAEQIESGGYSHNPDLRDRFNRCYEAAEDDADGSTHAEHIADFREYADFVYDELGRKLSRLSLDMSEEESAKADDAFADAREALDNDIDRCEEWHKEHGTLDQQIG